MKWPLKCSAITPKSGTGGGETALRLYTTLTESTDDQHEHVTGNAAWPSTFQLYKLQKSDLSAVSLQIADVYLKVRKDSLVRSTHLNCFLLWDLI